MPDTLADITAVFNWLLGRGIQRGDLILYGQSLGSGPTLHLAAKEPKIAGVILHAAFASGEALPPYLLHLALISIILTQDVC